MGGGRWRNLAIAGWEDGSYQEKARQDKIEVEIATREEQKIAVEIKSFISPSNVSDFHTALGQFLNYRDALEIVEPDRQLYLAVREPIYESFFKRRFIVAAIQRYQLQLIIYDVQREVIVQWL